MNLVSTGSFDRLQQALTVELLRTIKSELEKVDAPEDLIEHLTAALVSRWQASSTTRQVLLRMAKMYRHC